MVSNTVKVLKFRGIFCFLQLRMACPTNCSFQDATFPLVKSDKTNVIFLLLLLYILLLIKVKTQQSCQNLVRSSLLPENDEGMLSLISLGEVVGVEEEAMLLLLGVQGLVGRKDLGENLGCQVCVQSERRAIRDQHPLCCSFCFCTGDLLSVHSFSVCEIKIKCLFGRTLFCYDFKEVYANSYSQQLSCFNVWASVLIKSDEVWVLRVLSEKLVDS